eukprot:6470025-Pyramimonas_sp.AAC.1
MTPEQEFPLLRSIIHRSGSWAILMAFHFAEGRAGYLERGGFMFMCGPNRCAGLKDISVFSYRALSL